jgi:hypothetical protein
MSSQFDCGEEPVAHTHRHSRSPRTLPSLHHTHPFLPPCSFAELEQFGDVDALTRKLDAADEGFGAGAGSGRRAGRSLAQLEAETKARDRMAGGVARSAATDMAGGVGKKRARSETAGALALGGFGGGSDDDDDGGGFGGGGLGWGKDDDGDGDDDMGRRRGSGAGARGKGGDADEEDPFYAAVQAAAEAKRARKAEASARSREDTADFIRSRRDKYEMNEDAEHRAVGRDIMKNRGLTKYRKKEERNPRVHNRMKAEKFMKRRKGAVVPMRDPKEAAGYGGETTGIRTNISRSRIIHN